jgi:hypothetical protein
MPPRSPNGACCKRSIDEYASTSSKEFPPNTGFPFVQGGRLRDVDRSSRTRVRLHPHPGAPPPAPGCGRGLPVGGLGLVVSRGSEPWRLPWQGRRRAPRMKPEKKGSAPATTALSTAAGAKLATSAAKKRGQALLDLIARRAARMTEDFYEVGKALKEQRFGCLAHLGRRALQHDPRAPRACRGEHSLCRRRHDLCRRAA